jgi:hypothetical protein
MRSSRHSTLTAFRAQSSVPTHSSALTLDLTPTSGRARLRRRSQRDGGRLIDFKADPPLLRNDETLIPAKIVEACQKAQIELLVAPPADTDEPRPAPAPRSPYHRRRSR